MLRLLGVRDYSKRIYGLDVLRAWAILFVVWGHGKSFLPESVQHYLKYVYMDGVSIFFVLSGFLIGGILIREFETKQLTGHLMFNFWIRRWFRTLPNYFLILAVLVLLSSYKLPDFDLESAKMHLFFLQNFWTVNPDFFPEAWSLSVEEWFYILIPLFIYILLRLFRLPVKTAILFTAITVLISVTAFRYYRFIHLETRSFKIYDGYFRLQVITRLDSLMYGIIGALLLYYYRKLWFQHKKVLLVLGIILLTGLRVVDFFGLWPSRSLYNYVFSFSVTSLGTLFLLPYLGSWKKGKGIAFQTFTLISLISYSMYLVNYSLVKVFMLLRVPWDRYLGVHAATPFIKYALFWIFTVAISIILFRYFEMPVMKLRDHPKIKRWFPVYPKTNTKELHGTKIAPSFFDAGITDKVERSNH